jgi:hypothetical protein
MKKAFLIVGFLLPLFCFSQYQNKIITTDGKVYRGQILLCTNMNIHFGKNVQPPIKSRKIEYNLIKEIYGPLGDYSKNVILKKNKNVIFYPEYIDLDEYGKGMKLSNEITSGDYLQKAGTRYLTRFSFVFGGGLIAGVGIGSDSPPAFITGTFILLAGTAISISGHFQLIKAGKRMNGEAVSLSPSKEGIGFAINF